MCTSQPTLIGVGQDRDLIPLNHNNGLARYFSVDDYTLPDPAIARQCFYDSTAFCPGSRNYRDLGAMSASSSCTRVTCSKVSVGHDPCINLGAVRVGPRRLYLNGVGDEMSLEDAVDFDPDPLTKSYSVPRLLGAGSDHHISTTIATDFSALQNGSSSASTSSQSSLLSSYDYESSSTTSSSQCPLYAHPSCEDIGSIEEKSLKESMQQNRHSLQNKLMTRRPVAILVEQGIIPPLQTPPTIYAKKQKLERAKKGDYLKHKIQRRPERAELIQQHILPDTNVDPCVAERQRQLKRARLVDDLNERLSHRPGPLDLVRANVLQPDKNISEAIQNGYIKLDTEPSETKKVCHTLHHPSFDIELEELKDLKSYKINLPSPMDMDLSERSFVDKSPPYSCTSTNGYSPESMNVDQARTTSPFPFTKYGIASVPVPSHPTSLLDDRIHNHSFPTFSNSPPPTSPPGTVSSLNHVHSAPNLRTIYTGNELSEEKERSLHDSRSTQFEMLILKVPPTTIRDCIHADNFIAADVSSLQLRCQHREELPPYFPKSTTRRAHHHLLNREQAVETSSPTLANFATCVDDSLSKPVRTLATSSNGKYSAQSGRSGKFVQVGRKNLPPPPPLKNGPSGNKLIGTTHPVAAVAPPPTHGTGVNGSNVNASANNTTVNKLKIIKFHEYKGPPGVLNANSGTAASSTALTYTQNSNCFNASNVISTTMPLLPPCSSTYEFVLQQQRLFLQLQMECQQKLGITIPSNNELKDGGSVGSNIRLPPPLISELATTNYANSLRKQGVAYQDRHYPKLALTNGHLSCSDKTHTNETATTKPLLSHNSQTVCKSLVLSNHTNQTLTSCAVPQENIIANLNTNSTSKALVGTGKKKPGNERYTSRGDDKNPLLTPKPTKEYNHINRFVAQESTRITCDHGGKVLTTTLYEIKPLPNKGKAPDLSTTTSGKKEVTTVERLSESNIRIYEFSDEGQAIVTPTASSVSFNHNGQYSTKYDDQPCFEQTQNGMEKCDQDSLQFDFSSPSQCPGRSLVVPNNKNEVNVVSHPGTPTMSFSNFFDEYGKPPAPITHSSGDDTSGIAKMISDEAWNDEAFGCIEPADINMIDDLVDNDVNSVPFQTCTGTTTELSQTYALGKGVEMGISSSPRNSDPRLLINVANRVPTVSLNGSLPLPKLVPDKCLGGGSDCITNQVSNNTVVPSIQVKKFGKTSVSNARDDVITSPPPKPTSPSSSPLNQSETLISSTGIVGDGNRKGYKIGLSLSGTKVRRKAIHAKQPLPKNEDTVENVCSKVLVPGCDVSCGKDLNLDESTDQGRDKGTTQHKNISAPAKLKLPLEMLTVPELRAELKKRKMTVSGPKPTLLERLKPFTEEILSNRHIQATSLVNKDGQHPLINEFPNATNNPISPIAEPSVGTHVTETIISQAATTTTTVISEPLHQNKCFVTDSNNNLFTIFKSVENNATINNSTTNQPINSLPFNTSLPTIPILQPMNQQNLANSAILANDMMTLLLLANNLRQLRNQQNSLLSDESRPSLTGDTKHVTAALSTSTNYMAGQDSIMDPLIYNNLQLQTHIPPPPTHYSVPSSTPISQSTNASTNVATTRFSMTLPSESVFRENDKFLSITKPLLKVPANVKYGTVSNLSINNNSVSNNSSITTESGLPLPIAIKLQREKIAELQRQLNRSQLELELQLAAATERINVPVVNHQLVPPTIPRINSRSSLNVGFQKTNQNSNGMVSEILCNNLKNHDDDQKNNKSYRMMLDNYNDIISQHQILTHQLENLKIPNITASPTTIKMNQEYLMSDNKPIKNFFHIPESLPYQASTTHRVPSDIHTLRNITYPQTSFANIKPVPKAVVEGHPYMPYQNHQGYHDQPLTNPNDIAVGGYNTIAAEDISMASLAERQKLGFDSFLSDYMNRAKKSHAPVQTDSPNGWNKSAHVACTNGWIKTPNDVTNRIRADQPQILRQQPTAVTDWALSAFPHNDLVNINTSYAGFKSKSAAVTPRDQMMMITHSEDRAGPPIVAQNHINNVNDGVNGVTYNHHGIGNSTTTAPIPFNHADLLDLFPPEEDLEMLTGSPLPIDINTFCWDKLMTAD